MIELRSEEDCDSRRWWTKTRWAFPLFALLFFRWRSSVIQCTVLFAVSLEEGAAHDGRRACPLSITCPLRSFTLHQNPTTHSYLQTQQHQTHTSVPLVTARQMSNPNGGGLSNLPLPLPTLPSDDTITLDPEVEELWSSRALLLVSLLSCFFDGGGDYGGEDGIGYSVEG